MLELFKLAIERKLDFIFKLVKTIKTKLKEVGDSEALYTQEGSIKYIEGVTKLLKQPKDVSEIKHVVVQVVGG